MSDLDPASTIQGDAVAGSLFRTKSIDRLIADAHVIEAGAPAEHLGKASAGGHALEPQALGEHTLKRTLGAWSLVSLGIGGIIGAGIFVRTAAAIAERSGPSVTLAFIVAGIGCAFAGLCYDERERDRRTRSRSSWRVLAARSRVSATRSSRP